MKCATCGFAASDPTLTTCPFCKTQGNATAPAYAAASPVAAVWPPAPTAVPAAPPSGYADVGTLQKQRQNGILMAIIPLVVVQATSYAVANAGNLFAPYGSAFFAIVILAGIYPHFRGCADWAESKGYPRYEGRLLGILGWLGVLFLAIRRDKTRIPA